MGLGAPGRSPLGAYLRSPLGARLVEPSVVPPSDPCGLWYANPSNFFVQQLPNNMGVRIAGDQTGAGRYEKPAASYAAITDIPSLGQMLCQSIGVSAMPTLPGVCDNSNVGATSTALAFVAASWVNISPGGTLAITIIDTTAGNAVMDHWPAALFCDLTQNPLVDAWSYVGDCPLDDGLLAIRYPRAFSPEAGIVWRDLDLTGATSVTWKFPTLPDIVSTVVSVNWNPPPGPYNISEPCFAIPSQPQFSQVTTSALPAQITEDVNRIEVSGPGLHVISDAAFRCQLGTRYYGGP